MKATQAFLFLTSLLMSVALFIGAFFNPIHFATCAMSSFLCYAIYKEPRW